jgi:ABC-type methionine transport system permease subunit
MRNQRKKQGQFRKRFGVAVLVFTMLAIAIIPSTAMANSVNGGGLS